MKYLIPLAPLVLISCRSAPPPPIVGTVVQPVVAKIECPVIAPDVNNSLDTPDCKTAAERITKYVERGMCIADVRRLVGKPLSDNGVQWKWVQGVWAHPGVTFSGGLVSQYGAATERCE